MVDFTLPNFRRGDTIRIKFLYSANITDYELHLCLKHAVTDDDDDAALLVSTTAGDDPADDPAAGIMWLEMSAADTGAVALGEYYWALRQVDAGGDVYTLAPPVDTWDTKVTVISGILETIPAVP